jgi:alpha-L-fucosidase 2
MANTSYFFNTPAKVFEESFPLGNGKHGALVWGGIDTERIVINDDTFYSGAPEDLSRFKDAGKAEVWAKARELIFDGKLDEASDLLENDFNEYVSQKYLPIGDIYINFGHGGAVNYKRELDLESGVCRVEYDLDGVHFERTLFVPSAEDAVILRLRASEAAKISFSLDFKTENTPIDRFADGSRLVTVAQAPTDYDRTRSMKQEPIFSRSTKEGDSVRFALSILPILKGGELVTNDGGITVKDADEVTLFVFCKTSYIDPYSAPTKDALSEVMAAEPTDFDEALARHERDFSSLFNRTTLSLGATERNIDQFERLSSFDGSDLGLYELLFNFGKYLTISGSREGSKATNLQGIWNHTMNPPWESTYTMNINLQMNYWPTLVTNLRECYTPLVDYLKSTMAAGRLVARDFYGARGFVIHPNSDIWAHAVPLGKCSKYSAQYSP